MGLFASMTWVNMHCWAATMALTVAVLQRQLSSAQAWRGGVSVGGREEWSGTDLNDVVPNGELLLALWKW